MKKIPVTKIGHQRLQNELQDLKNVKRPQVIKAIATARAHGDLKENAEYHAAKEEQGFIEGRIRDIESKLANCEVIDIANHTNDGKVIFGATVTLINLDDDTEVVYQIVGEDEADIKERKISIAAPIARAMIGKYVDSEIAVKTPQGDVAYVITQVDYT